MRISDWSSDVCSSDLNGRGWGPGGRHGMGGMGAFAGDLSELASKLGVDEAKLRDAMTAVRDDLKNELKDRSEERRVGKECVVRVDLGGRRIIKKKKTKN